MNTSLHSWNAMSTLQRGRELPHGCLFYHWMTLIFPSTRVRSEMQFASDMAAEHSYQMQLWLSLLKQSCHDMPYGGFPTIWHNELRDVTASLLTEVCHNVATEPRLQPLSGETLTLRSAITTDDVRLDIRARGFWSVAEDVYFYVRVFHPNSPSNSMGSISAAYKKHEDVKKWAYGQRVREIEHGVFTPLVFSTTGEMGQEATKVGGYAHPKTTEAILRHHQLAEVQAILCRCPIIHHVHPWNSVIQPPTPTRC